MLDLVPVAKAADWVLLTLWFNAVNVEVTAEVRGPTKEMKKCDVKGNNMTICDAMGNNLYNQNQW